jgi:exodeoxyribonuclease VII large subunit
MPALTDILQPHHQRIDEVSERMKFGMSQNVAAAKSRFAASEGALRPALLKQRVVRATERLERLALPKSLVTRPLEDAKQRLNSLWRLAEQLSPDAPLKRGYARISSADGDLVNNRAAAIDRGAINLHFHDGDVAAQVIDGASSLASNPPKPPQSKAQSKPGRVKKAADDRQADLF